MPTDEELADRRLWAQDISTRMRQRCMGCEEFSHTLEVHEIERRSHAAERWAQRCNYLLICRRCHVGKFATMPHARQLAYKFLFDREHFDLRAWLAIRDRELRAPLRVFDDEVLYHVQELEELLK